MRQTGFSKLEFAIVLIIFGVLAYFLFDRLHNVEQESERLEVNLTIRHINIGLKLAIGEHIMRGQEARIAELLDKNLLDFLDQQKRKVDTDTTLATPGSWHFSSATRTLSYIPRQPEAFGGNHQLAWQLTGHRDQLGRIVDLRVEPLK